MGSTRFGEHANVFEQLVAQVLALRLQVVARLEVHPERVCCTKVAGEAQRSVGSYGALAQDDLVDAAGVHVDVLGQPVLAHAQRLGEMRSARLTATRRDAETAMTPSHPGAVWERVSQVIPERATVVVDGGIVTMHIRPTLKMRLPLRGTWEAAGSGAIGAGIPFALAAKLARPQEPAFVLTGDGSVGYGIMELDTALRHNLPIIVIVANDSAWGSEKYMIEDTFGRTIGCELRPETRYDRIAQAMGAHGEFVEHLEDVRPAVERALASGLPSLVNISVSTVPGLLQRRVVAERKSSAA